jgi:hypothetical protein
MRYLNDPALQQDPPGTYYGDKSGPRVHDDAKIADVTDDKVKVSGSFTTGIGYSKNGGNSHYNAATLNLSKNYTTDEGKTHGVNLNIHVSEGKGRASSARMAATTAAGRAGITRRRTAGKPAPGLGRPRSAATAACLVGVDLGRHAGAGQRPALPAGQSSQPSRSLCRMRPS